jgi:hypothetical protein
MGILDHPIIVGSVAVLSWPVYTTLAKLFFDDKYENFGDAAKYSIQPDWLSLLKGRYWDDWDASIKLQLFVAMCIGWVAAVSEIICRIWF